MPRGSDSPGHLGFRWVHFQFDSAASQLLVLTNQQLDDLSCRLFLLLRVPHSVPLVHQPWWCAAQCTLKTPSRPYVCKGMLY